MTPVRRSAEDRARIVAFGLCHRGFSDGPPDSLDEAVSFLSTHERPILEDAARLLRERLALVEGAIAKRA